MDSSLQIDRLADHPEAIPILKAWFETEWTPYYGPDGPGNAEQDLLRSCNRDVLPITMVALLEGEVCGTVALKHESVTTHGHLSPWLAALLVAPAFRRRGVGEHLIAAVEEGARQLGFAYLYVGTGAGSGSPASTLRRRGWEFIERGPYFASEVSIFRKAL